MSKLYGMLLTCDRCKKQIFLEYTGQTELSGGFERYDKYADIPKKGWSTEILAGKTYNFCPQCSEDFQLASANYMQTISPSRIKAPVETIPNTNKEKADE